MSLTRIKSRVVFSFIQPSIGGEVIVVIDTMIDWFGEGSKVAIEGAGLYQVVSFSHLSCKLKLLQALAEPGAVVSESFVYPVLNTSETADTSGLVSYAEEQELTEEQKETARNNIGATTADTTGLVSYAEEQELTEEQKETARNNIGATTADTTGLVSYAEEQELTEAQKETARNNIGATTADTTGLVSYAEEQELTEEQKETARNNIGATTADTTGLVSYAEEQELTEEQKETARNNIGATTADTTGLVVGDGVAKITASESEPPSPAVNDIWIQLNVINVDGWKVSAKKEYITTNQNDFAYYINLADMPASFWAEVSNGGGGIRVYESDGTTELAREVVSCDVANQTGELWIKADFSSTNDTIINIKIEAEGSDYEATDTYGANAVWSSGYKLVDHDIDGTDSTSNNCEATFKVPNIKETWKETHRVELAVTAHQGAAWDGTYYYVVGVNALYKYDSSWNLISQNDDLISSVTSTPVDHFSAPACYDGKVYIAAEHNVYPCVEIARGTMVTFDPDTLSVIDEIDISASQGTDECVAIGIDELNDELYIPSFCGNVINVYTLSTMAFARKIVPNCNLVHMQGIVILDDYLYICCDGCKAIVKLDKLGNVVGTVYNSSEAQPAPNPNTGGGGALEGIYMVGDTMLLTWFVDAGPHYYMSTLEKEVSGAKTTYKLGQGGLLTEGFNNVSYKDGLGGNVINSAEGSISVWFKPCCAIAPATNVWDNAIQENNWECFIGANTDRYISARAQRDPRVGWVDAPNGTITLGNWYHIVFTWSNGGNAYLYINGVQKGTPSAYTSITAGLFYLAGGNSGNKPGIGAFDELRILSRALTDGEVLAQYNNQNSAADGYVIEESYGVVSSAQLKIWTGADWLVL